VVSKAMGGVDAVVNLGINTIDVAYSVGDFLDRFYLLLRNISWTIVAIGPIAVSLADKSGASCP
jgi:hypothetical protein